MQREQSTTALMEQADVLELARALTLIDSVEEAQALLLDLCTTREIADLAQRLDVASHLVQGESYVSVTEATGASSTTVSRVSKCLTAGAGGYRFLLERLGYVSQL